MKANDILFTGRKVSEQDANKYNEMIDTLNNSVGNVTPERYQEMRDEVHQYFISLCYREVDL